MGHPVEKIPEGEAEAISRIAELTLAQLRRRYSAGPAFRRAVHAKGHACVTARFDVLSDLPEPLCHGVFAVPGRTYPAHIRFSNADVLDRRDSTPGTDGGLPVHGSRGMAVKLTGVDGPALESDTPPGALTQDFLMVNQPVFAFANVEDYEVLSRVLANSPDDDARGFFSERLPPRGTPPSTPAHFRALRTAQIVGRVRSASLTDPRLPAFQPPPASPVDNAYFGAAPFLLGPDQVMRFRVRPVAPSLEEPDPTDENYLRSGLLRRLRDASKGDVEFHFEVQVRGARDIDPERDIEDASTEWAEPDFQHVATIAIPLQEFDSDEQRAQCERLVFTPWNGLEAHRPLGGINRMRRTIYQTSAGLRNASQTPAR